MITGGGGARTFALSVVASAQKRDDVLGVYAFGSAGVATAAGALFGAYSLLFSGSLGSLIPAILLGVAVPASAVCWYTLFTIYTKYPSEVLVGRDGFEVRFSNGSSWRYAWLGSRTGLQICDYRPYAGRKPPALFYLIGPSSRPIPITLEAFEAIQAQSASIGVRDETRILYAGTPATMAMHTLLSPKSN
ncbi:MAG: hypothetical protein L3K14_02355 [Thermoplasmata archaeon]|nr:hypothetical protein [Thermoplasmata archaeon]